MHTRKLHALIACALFLLAASIYGALSGHALELWRVAFWSMVGVASYIALSGVFGFDPHRTRIARYRARRSRSTSIVGNCASARRRCRCSAASRSRPACSITRTS